MTPTPRAVPCPRCGKQVVWTAENPFRPFCSERCKTVDLGAWATEQYRVAAVGEDDEPEAPSAEPPAAPQ